MLEGEPNSLAFLPELLKYDTVIVTPHCAARAPESTQAATELILANLNAFFAGKPLLMPIAAKA